MTVVMTLMVRDEADIIGAMVDHHLRQGVDMIIATDNGSVDGTTEILEGYAGHGVLELRHDPVHRKQQGSIVTAMARDAYTKYTADWVINADADEMWLPVSSDKTLATVFPHYDKAWQAFRVDVTDMIGLPAKRGTGLERLSFRDDRTNDQLRAVGLRARSTPNAVHIGHPDIEVGQGNHFVNLESLGSPPPNLALQVLHFQWRSWEQFVRKVGNAGRAYDANPELTPSPNHHGMRDYRRLQSGMLLAWYVLRHPTSTELLDPSSPFQRHPSLPLDVTSAVADIPFDEDELSQQRAFGVALAALEADLAAADEESIRRLDMLHERLEYIALLEDELGKSHATLFQLQQARFGRTLRRARGTLAGGHSQASPPSQAH